MKTYKEEKRKLFFLDGHEAIRMYNFRVWGFRYRAVPDESKVLFGPWELTIELEGKWS